MTILATVANALCNVTGKAAIRLAEEEMVLWNVTQDPVTRRVTKIVK